MKTAHYFCLIAGALLVFTLLVLDRFGPRKPERSQRFADSPSAITSIHDQFLRGEELQQRGDLVRSRLEGRSRVVDEVLTRRMNLLKAATRYCELFASSQEAQEMLRIRWPEILYAEALCRQVIADVEAAVERLKTPESGVGVVAQLKKELADHLREQGIVQLPEDATPAH